MTFKLIVLEDNDSRGVDFKAESTKSKSNLFFLIKIHVQA